MAWFLFEQNNSGGGWDIDDYVTTEVWIEASAAIHANAFANDIGIYFDGVSEEIDCGCCGDRWYEVTNRDAKKEPKLDFSAWGNPGFVYLYRSGATRPEKIMKPEK